MNARLRTHLMRLGAALAMVLVIGLAVGLALAPGAASAMPASAYRMGLEFVDDHGAKRALSEWSGRPVIIAMAYGACRSICSTTLRTLEEIQARADRNDAQFNFVVVSIDPVEDTPQAWADYRKARHLQRANWTFVSGSNATRTPARFLGVKFWAYHEHVIRDLKIMRLGPDGGIDAMLDWNHRQLEPLF